MAAASPAPPRPPSDDDWPGRAKAAFGVGFWRDKHISFIRSVDSEDNQKSVEYHAMQYLRMSAVYWAVAAADLVSGTLVRPAARAQRPPGPLVQTTGPPRCAAG